MTDATEPTVVTQADRDWLASDYSAIGDSLNARRIRNEQYVCEEVDVALRSLARHRLAAEQSRASTPAVGREAIAKVIDPGAWTDPAKSDAAYDRTPYRNASLAKADAILALHPPASDDAIAAKDAEKLVGAYDAAVRESQYRATPKAVRGRDQARKALIATLTGRQP